MFEIIEMPTANVIASVGSIEEALRFIEDIENFDRFNELHATYGSVRRVQQELTIYQANTSKV